MPANGLASWNITKARQTLSSAKSANASLSVGYSNVDWDFLKVVYGWAAVQYQAWARGELVVGGNDTQHVIMHTDSILEYWIGDEHYFGGDFYSYRNAPPVLHLAPGSHKVDIRLVRDVRAFGGILEPTIDVMVDVRQVTGYLELAKAGIVISDVIDGKLASPMGSVHLRNSGEQDVEILSIGSSNVSSQISFAGLKMNAQTLLKSDADVADQENVTSPNSYHVLPINIVAGQTRPIAFDVSLPTDNATSMEYNIIYRLVDSESQLTLSVSQSLNHVGLYAPHKMTFRHPGGMVSYAMLRPPAKNATCRSKRSKLPILLQLHGAGLEADNPMVTGALDPVSDLCAWVMFPTGVTPWSGDDWHNWGFADVEAAVEAIPDWISNNHWTGPGVDINRWIVSGHSNGGQGTWFALTHRPDKVLAAAPVSGYTSIQMYVPYQLWQGADPKRTAAVSASLNSYRHEMLMSNARGIPIQQQHGGIDDNVPAYNSRLLAQQLYLANASSSYNEVTGFNHWWEDVMTTPALVDFYYLQTDNEDELPRKLEEFTITIGDPGDMGSKGGIRVKHLEDPGQYGRVSVRGHNIKTTNVQDVEFDAALWKGEVTIDEQILKLAQISRGRMASISVYKSVDGWELGSIDTEIQQVRRSGRQLGSMTAILRTQGPFIIRHAGSTSTSHIALQISRNLHQYFQADTEIVRSMSYPIALDASGNVFTLAISSSLEAPQHGFPLHADESGVTVTDSRGREQRYGKEARGAAFLRPLEDERLELVIWGADEEGLQLAARTVPLLTGVGQPDFVVFGKSAKWRGIEGVLAMGFFDSNWGVTPCSVVDGGLDMDGAKD